MMWENRNKEAKESIEYLIDMLQKSSNGNKDDSWKCLLLRFKYELNGSDSISNFRNRNFTSVLNKTLAEIVEMVTGFDKNEVESEHVQDSIEYLITELWNYTAKISNGGDSAHLISKDWFELCFKLSNFLTSTKELYKNRLVNAYGPIMETMGSRVFVVD